MWTLEHAVEGGDEVAIEWTMAFDHPRTGGRCLDRGAEFLASATGGSARCARTTTAASGEPLGDLVGFDHAARGHTTL